MTSNPKKLAAIGKELDQLSKIINDLTPVSEMPFGARCKSRKEKNKLASRACRLKKKAQHEANKLKLHGLEEEHSKSPDFLCWKISEKRSYCWLSKPKTEIFCFRRPYPINAASQEDLAGGKNFPFINKIKLPAKKNDLCEP